MIISPPTRQRKNRFAQAGTVVSTVDVFTKMRWMFSGEKIHNKNPPTEWWFRICFIFTAIWGRFQCWLYFSKGLKPPTSQTCFCWIIWWLLMTKPFFCCSRLRGRHLCVVNSSVYFKMCAGNLHELRVMRSKTRMLIWNDLDIKLTTCNSKQHETTNSKCCMFKQPFPM